MIIYDEAHELAKLLKNSEEYRIFLATKQALDTDEQAKKMVKDFIAKQMDIEYAAMAGKPEDKDKIAQLQKMGEFLSLNRRASDFLQAYMRFQRVMADIYKIIGESVAEGMDFFGKQ